MKRLLCLPLLLLCGCVPVDDEENQGIAVGNPGVVAMSLAEAAEFTLVSAEASVSALGWAGCGDGDRLTAVNSTIDLLAANAVEFPEGDWCGVVVRFAGPLEIEATWTDGVGSGSLFATVEVPELQLGAVDGDLVVDEDAAFALELASPDWLDAVDLGIADGVDLVVDAESPEHTLLLAALTDETALFDDTDGSGQIEQSERDAGPAALPTELAFNPDPMPGSSADAAGMSACSCSGGGDGASGLALLLLLSAGSLARRRSRSPRPARRRDRPPAPPAAS